MNRLDLLFDKKKENILAVYFTAGYPNLDDTITIIKLLQANNTDIIEVGVPYSDPLADGPTIQRTGEKSLLNGMNLDLLFKQLHNAKDQITTPLILMGYYNQFLQYGAESFLKKANEANVAGLILPDMPVEVYAKQYKKLFEQYDMKISFLITPQTSDERIKTLHDATTGFLYIVSSASTTGAKASITATQNDYFKRIEALNLTQTKLIGFGISTAESYQNACKYAGGAIIGSAFLDALKGVDLTQEVSEFLQSIR